MKYFSIVIPLYNKGPHIERALQSVLSQSYQNYEIIIVDDGSTDNGVEIVKKFKDRRIRLIQKENSGVSVARNKGVREAKYELIAFLDADDEWCIDFLKVMVDTIYKYPEARMLGTNYYKVFRDGKKIIPKVYDVPLTSGIIDNYFKASVKRNPISSSAVVIHKEVFRNIGGFPEALKRGEDNYMWCKTALLYPVAFINTPMAIRYYNAVNRISNNNKLIDDFPLLDYIKMNKIELDPSTYYYVIEFIYKKYLGRAVQCLKAGNKEKAKTFLAKASNTKIFKKKYLILKILTYFPLLNKLNAKSEPEGK